MIKRDKFGRFIKGSESPCGMLGKKLSEEAKRKIGEWNKGKVISEETRKKIGKAHKGKYWGGGYLKWDKHLNWKGNNIKFQTGRQRTRTLYPDYKPCEICNKSKTERHHIDFNPINTDKNNIQYLCRSCHTKKHKN